MKKYGLKYLTLVSVLLIISVFLPACRDESDIFGSSGILADKNVISSIRQEIADKKNSSLAQPGDVFWTEGGALWHTTDACSYLANSKTVYHGTLNEAEALGKSRGCDRCGGGTDDGSIYDKIENNEIARGDVFFTKESTLRHSCESCPLLLDEEKVYHSNLALAVSLGKCVECEECKEK